MPLCGLSVRRMITGNAMTDAPASFQAAFPASQNTGSGWSVVIFFATQIAQIVGGALAILLFAILYNPSLLGLLTSWNGVLQIGQQASAMMWVITAGYFVIGWFTLYPLAAMVIAGFWRKAWAANVHLAVTLLAGQVVTTSWFTTFDSDRLISTIQIPLIAGPIAGYFVFRRLAHMRPPGTSALFH